MSPEFADIPSPISHNIDEITNAERRFSDLALSQTELEEYNRLSDEYNRNEQTIPLLKEEVYQMYCEYAEMMKQQIGELHAMQEKEELFVENYEVKQLADMKRKYIAAAETRQTAILSQIEEKYQKPVEKMAKDTRSIVQNMNRSVLGKVIFAIVWILELVWNWLREEWAKVNSNMEEEKSGSEERVMERVEGRKRKERRTKNGKRRVARKKEE